MQGWLRVTLFLCLFGILREIRPSEPFVTEFLLGEWRNITEEQLNRDVYPVGTYSYLSQLVVVFLITDFLRFKPIIILSGISGTAVYAVLLWTSSLAWLQVSQFLYGMFMATEVAYLTYIYAKVDASKYARVSSYTRIAALTGRFLSGVSSQLLIHFKLLNFRDLNYITFAAQILSTFWALWLPAVQYSIYFHRRTSVYHTTRLSLGDQQEKHIQQIASIEERSFCEKLSEASMLIVRHARSSYARPKVLAWSALYAVSLALFVQAQTYIQLLWRIMQEESDNPVAFNGAVEAVQTLLGAGGAYAASSVTGSYVPAVAAAAQGAALFVGTYFPKVYVSYAGYVVMGMLFHYTITLASAKIASQLCDESCFGLIFGINTLIGTGLQALLTFTLIQSLLLGVRMQYMVLSALYATLAAAWLAGWLQHACRHMHTIHTISIRD